MPSKSPIVSRRRGRLGSPNAKTLLSKILLKKHAGATGETHTVLGWLILTLRQLAIEGNVPADNIYQRYFGTWIEPRDDADLAIFGIPRPITDDEWIAKWTACDEKVARISTDLDRGKTWARNVTDNLAQKITYGSACCHSAELAVPYSLGICCGIVS